MKNKLRKVLLGLLLPGLLGSTATAQGRIATIDVQKVFDNYWKTKQANAALQDRVVDMEKEFKNMGTDYDKAKEEYQKLLASANDQVISQDERDKQKRSAEEKLKYLRDQEDTMRQYRAQATTTLEEQKRRMISNIMGEIKVVVASKAKAAGVALVIDSAAETPNRTPIVLFNAGDNDLTDQVLKQLNSTAPADLPKTDEKKEEKKDEKKTGK